MKTLLLSLLLLLTQVLSAQIFTRVDEYPAFPGCENALNRCDCNQSQLKIIGDSRDVQINMTVDGKGRINDWETVYPEDIDVKSKIEMIINDLKNRGNLLPATIANRPVNYNMTLLVSIVQ